MPVERGKVREYAVATGATHAGYLDDPTAPIPPTFLATVVFWHDVHDVIVRPEVLAACERAGVRADVGNLLSLEQEYVFLGELPRAGDVLEPVSRFDGVETKVNERARMVIIHFAVEFRDPATGGVRAECRYTSAYRQAAA